MLIDLRNCERFRITLFERFQVIPMTHMHRIQSSHHHGLPTILRRTLSVLGLCLLLMLFVAPQQAQAQNPGEKGYWKQHAAAQISTLLRSSDSALREQGMELVIKLQYDETVSRDFSDLRGQLYSIFFDDRNSDEQRILALSALFATDSDKTTQTLATWVDEESSPRVRRHVQLALHQRG